MASITPGIATVGKKRTTPVNTSKGLVPGSGNIGGSSGRLFVGPVRPNRLTPTTGGGKRSNMKFLTMTILTLLVIGSFLVGSYNYKLNDNVDIDLDKVYELQHEAQLRLEEYNFEQQRNKLILLYELNYYKTGNFEFKQVADYLRSVVNG